MKTVVNKGGALKVLNKVNKGKGNFKIKSQNKAVRSTSEEVSCTFIYPTIQLKSVSDTKSTDKTNLTTEYLSRDV